MQRIRLKRNRQRQHEERQQEQERLQEFIQAPNQDPVEMEEDFCLTGLEAAEMAGIELAELMRIAESEAGVAIEVDGAWRVDLNALSQIMYQDDLRQAA